MKSLCLFLIILLLIGSKARCYSQELPIKPTRTISFTTDEGTYMNLDISPDGKTLVFDLLGDLYSVPATGGNATQLTRGIALNLRPVFSPDGKRIAYISDISGSFHLNVRDISGTFHRVLGRSDEDLGYTYNKDAVWLPGSNYVSIAGTIYGVTGGKLSPETSIAHPLRFSPDGQVVFYLDSGRLCQYNYATNVNTVILKTVISSDVAGNLIGNISPDGRWWAFIADSNSKRCLILQDLINNTRRILVPSFLEKDPTYHHIWTSPRFAFSPDSKRIFIAYGGKIHRVEIGNGTDQVIPFIAIVKADLGPHDYNTFRVSQDSVKVRYTRSANGSPDGRQLVFSALNRIYVKDLPNGKARILVPQSISQFQPVYSPDGKWIAYVSWCDTSGGYLWRVSSSGGEPEQLTHIAGHYQRPVWSPDGKFIAVLRGDPKLGDRDDPGLGQLELIPLNGGSMNIIDDSIPLWNQLNFSPDGSRVVYKWHDINNEEGYFKSSQIVSKDLNGEDKRVLFFFGTHLSQLHQVSLSPDGRFIVYSLDEDLYLLPVCKLTGPQVIYDETQKISAIRFAEGVDPYWERGGKILAWNYGNRFYRINPDKIIARAEEMVQKKEPSKLSESKYLSITVPPDQVVDLNVTVPPFYAHGVIALTDVRIITMHGGQVIEHGTIVMKDGRFTAVGSMATVLIPRGAKILNLRGTTVMPGLVDLHLHMRIPPDIFPQQSWMYLINLAFGVTTARDPSLSFDSYGYKELLESGQMIGPRLYTVGRAARIDDGMMRCDDLNDAKILVHKRAELGGTVVKQYMLPTRMQRQWLQIACRAAGLNMTNEGAYDPILQIGMMKDGSTGVEHNPVWGEVYKDVVSFVAASQTFLTPTLQVCYGEKEGREYFDYKFWHQPDPKLMHFTGDQDQLNDILKTNPKDTLHPGFIYPALIDDRIRKSGGRIALGSHGNDEGIGVHNELWALQMGGLTNMAALRAGTITGAEALGIQKDIGSIEVGKIADLIILNKNPLEDIHNSREIRYVMKDGVLYDGNTLDMIWPTAKKCPEWRLK